MRRAGLVGPRRLSGMTEPLRIAVPIHSFEPGGVERVALNLALQWQGTGHHVAIVLGRNEGLDRDNSPPGLNYYTRPKVLLPPSLEGLWMIWCLFRYLLRERVDVIFCPGNTYTVVCVAMKIVFGKRCPPVVVKVSNDLVRADKTPLRRAMYRIWLKINGLALEHFVGLAEPMSSEIVDRMGVMAERVTTIHDPALDRCRLDRLLTAERQKPVGRPLRYVAVGRLAPQKNFSLLLRAFAAGARPDDCLVIVGDGGKRTALEAEVCRLGLTGRVTFVGHVGSPDPYYLSADCLLLSSHYEGVPAVVIEAIAAGLPVIATNCAASMEMLLGNGTRGVLVPVNDLDALAAAIASPESLPNPCWTARNFAARFTLEEAALSYLRVMGQAIGKSQPAQSRHSATMAR